MRRPAILLATLAAVASMAAMSCASHGVAQAPAEAAAPAGRQEGQKPASGRGPVLVFPEGTTINFGRFVDYRIQRGELPIVNAGSEPLVILDMFAECGCTVASYPHEPIAPGDTASISIKFDGRNRSIGEFEKAIRIRSNADERPRVIFVKGIISR